MVGALTSSSVDWSSCVDTKSDSCDATRVCLISAGPPSSNPRLVKDASAFVNAGYRVHAIVGSYDTPLAKLDEEILRGVGATFARISLGSRLSYKLRRLRQIVAERFASMTPPDALAAWAASPQTSRLANAATAVRADLYIGHTLAALPAAVLAAKNNGALAGFDAEDFHPGETGHYRTDLNAARLCQRLLPRCQHLTAASPLIGKAFQELCGVSMTTVLNVFPRYQPISVPTKLNSTLGLYWFSQTIGPGRGLEAFIAGAARAATSVGVHLRGIVSDNYRSHLAKTADDAGLQEPIEFLPPAPPDDMVRLAAEHHVGLSLEQSEPVNRNLCLTNKVFTYLAAGRPQLMSRTSAQITIANELGPAAELIDLQDSADVARGIDALADPRRHDAASAAATTLHHERYCWELEQEALLRNVRETFGAHS